MNTSIVRLRGVDSKADFESIAELAGVGVIKLRHHKAFDNIPVSMRGFQGGTIEVITRRSGSGYTWSPKRTTDNEDTFTARTLFFEKDKKTGENIAVIPDTPYNRSKLAKGFYTPTAPKIKDSAIEKEVKEMADRIHKERSVSKTKEDIIKETLSEKEILEKKLKEKESEIKKLTDRKAILSQDPHASLVDYLRKEYIKEVETEQADFLGDIKKEYKEDYPTSEVYQTVILLEVEKRLKSKLKKEGISYVEPQPTN